VLLAEIWGIAQEALEHARMLATSIYPNLVEGRGFASALRSAASRVGVAADVDAPAVADFPREIIAALYWAWIEVLTSASPGSQVAISVADGDGGVAFDISSTGDNRGGLDRLRDRIEPLDGHLEVAGRQGGVSRVHGWLPVSR
jgi:signal transduction histidine kinase